MSQSKSIFSTIDASIDILPRTVQEQLLLMAVLASGVAVSSEMLASLWDVVRNYSVPVRLVHRLIHFASGTFSLYNK